jgi:hypothetical protein
MTMDLECHYVVCVRCGTKTPRLPETLANRRVLRRPGGEFVVHATQPEGCRVCGEHAGVILFARSDALLPRRTHTHVMRRRAPLADSLASKHAARMARLADEADRYAGNCRALDEFASRRGFRERGALHGLRTHQPEALWFDGARCFMGVVLRMTSDFPESARERTMEQLGALASALRSREIERALYVFVVDVSTEVRRWHEATRKRMRDAGLAVVGPCERATMGDHGFAVVYPIGSRSSYSPVARGYRRAVWSLVLPRSRGPRDVGE